MKHFCRLALLGVRWEDEMISKFEEALVNCSREPIHIPGAIRPFGVLLALDDELRLSRG